MQNVPRKKPAYRRLTASWVLYDVASSGYVLMMLAAAFPLFLKIDVFRNAAWSEAAWGVILFISNITAGLAAPLVGAAADESKFRLEFLAVLTGVTCLTTAAIALPIWNPVAVGFLFCLSYMSYLLSASVYDALLKSCVANARLAWVSGLGWGLGYMGGLICYWLSQSVFTSTSQVESGNINRNGFAIVALYYAVLATVSMVGMGSVRATRTLPSVRELWSRSVARLGSNFRKWNSAKELHGVILGAQLVSGGAMTLGFYVAMMLSNGYGLTPGNVVQLSAIFTLASIPATVLCGLAALRVSRLLLLFMLIPVWLLILILLMVASGWWMGVSVAIGLAMTVGPSNALARSAIAEAIGEEEAAEVFGIAALVNRVTIAVGTLAFGVLTSLIGPVWPAVALTYAVMALGYVKLSKCFGTRAAAGPLPQG